MNARIQFGLLALIVLSALAAIGVTILIARRQDISRAARRAFLLSNAALVLCMATLVAGISIYPATHLWGLTLEGAAVVFLVLKFVFVRQFAHRIRREHPRTQSAALPHGSKGI
jgi:cytochrome bd-type quinol oxidase subunit 2